MQYSKAKLKEIRSLMDDRWNTEEKITQCKGLLTIFGRERKKELNEANRIRRMQTRKIRELRKDCHYFRTYLGNTLFGNKQRLRNALQPDRLVQLAFQMQMPVKVLDYFQHSNNTRQKDLDLVRYRKHKRMEEFTNLKLEKAELQDHIEAGFENVKFRRSVQILTNRIQMFVVRQNAAAEVCKLYQNMVELLRNDSHYFDAMLSVLNMDCQDQCRSVLRAAEIGQLAQEELNDIRDDYKRLEREVRLNMKEREREVRRIRREAEELFIRCRLLTRAESYAYVYQASQTDVFSDQGADGAAEIEEQDELEHIMKHVQEATLAPTFNDVFPRMLSQLDQEEALLKQMKKMTDFRNRILLMKHHSELMLASLEHQVSTSTVRYSESKEQVERDVAEEKYRISRENEAVQEHGEMLATLKVHLQCLFETVHRVKEESMSDENLKSSSSEMVVEEFIEEQTPEQIAEKFPLRMEPNSKLVLLGIGEKLELLLNNKGRMLDDETLEHAKILRDQQIVVKRGDMVAEADYDIALLADHETEDSNVMSRSDVKLASKQLVDHNINLNLIAQGRGPRKRNF